VSLLLNNFKLNLQHVLLFILFLFGILSRGLSAIAKLRYYLTTDNGTKVLQPCHVRIKKI